MMKKEMESQGQRYLVVGAMVREKAKVTAVKLWFSAPGAHARIQSQRLTGKDKTRSATQARTTSC